MKKSGRYHLTQIIKSDDITVFPSDGETQTTAFGSDAPRQTQHNLCDTFHKTLHLNFNGRNHQTKPK